MQIVLFILVFVSMSFFVYGLVETGFRRRVVRARLNSLDVSGGGISLDEIEMSRSFVERVLMPMFSGMGRLLGGYTSKNIMERIQKRLSRAGYPKTEPGAYLGIKFVAGAATGLLMLVFTVATHVPVANMPVLLALFALVGAKMPDMYLNIRERRRKIEISDTLPDLLDLLTVSVEAGLGFDQALMHSTGKMKGCIVDEVKRLLQEMRMGVKRTVALRAMADRVQLPDLTSFCATLIQADQLGVSIAKVLKVQSDLMREKRRQRSEEAAMKAPMKLLVPLGLFIFPTILFLLLTPAGIQIVEAFAGSGAM